MQPLVEAIAADLYDAQVIRAFAQSRRGNHSRAATAEIAIVIFAVSHPDCRGTADIVRK
jgi:hypothetical protein